jgi:putative membrane-bound dehydrogenase-like protein
MVRGSAHMRRHDWIVVVVVLTGAVGAWFGCVSSRGTPSVDVAPGTAVATRLTVRQDEAAGTIAVYRASGGEPLVTQHARPDQLPYLHPIAAPDGRGELTQFSPDHHRHQTGLYWGFTRLNGRDYFHNYGGDYWRRVSADVVEAEGDVVRWQTVYELLDAAGSPVLTETQRWAMREAGGRFVLDLEWRGLAHTDVTVAQYDYGGLFLRMPWHEGIRGEVVNAARQRNERAEGQRAMWFDVGMQVAGRDDLAHIAIFDHPDNGGYPHHWRVDGQLGVGAARSRTADWSIPSGETEVVRHRLIAHTGTLDDVAMTDAWMEYTGVRSTSVLWGIAQREGRTAEFLTPERAVAEMTTMPGYKVNVWAAEPMLTQPMAFTWDDRGRLWIAENRDYESRGTGFSGSGDSRILILEDTDGDGTADSRKVFLEGIAFPAALAVGLGGVFIGAPPNLLFVPDSDGDDRADMDAIEVLLTGWGIRDRHETINSLHWGPDGWLYGLQGFATPSKVRKPEGQGRIFGHRDTFPEDLLEADGTDINGGVWRYHPVSREFEVVAHGFSNPWGIDHDPKGQLLMSACVIPHLWHVVPGGIYHRQGGQHFNPYVYSDITTIADHRHRSAHGGARIYQSDAFPASQYGRIFMANIHEHAVLSDVLERSGSGFIGRHGDDFLLANNAQFVGFSLEIGPDGALYVLDWHDADICGADVLHKDTGRIFRVAPDPSQAESWPGRYGNLQTFRDDELVQLLTKRSAWHARRAQLILQHRAMTGHLQPGTHDQLRAMFQRDTNPDWRLRAMWALHVTGGWSNEALIDALGDRDEYIRAWAVQLLLEKRDASRAALERFARLAREDESPVVRLYLASALQRLDAQDRWPIAEALLAHAEDADDHNLPRMIWLGVEPLIAVDTAWALDRVARGNIPLVTRFAARRAVDADATDALVAVIGRTPPQRQLALVEGLRDALEGRPLVQAPVNWPAVFDRLRRGRPEVAGAASEVSQLFGDAEAAERSLALAGNVRASVDERRLAIRRLASQRRPELANLLPALIDDAALRSEAIRAVAAYDRESLGSRLLERYASFSAGDRTETIQTLAARPTYGRLLTRAIADGTVARTDVPRHIARQLLRVVGTGFLEVWGPIEESANDARQYSRYRRLLTDEAVAAADARRGRAVFDRTCGACHRMYGDGGILGPDLTGSNRANLDYLLSNVLDPSGDVADDYRMVVVTTRDGRTYAGNVIAETDRQVTMRVVGQDSVALNTADIQSRDTTAVSMMPSGLFDALTDPELLDLVAFLRTAEPPSP